MLNDFRTEKLNPNYRTPPIPSSELPPEFPTIIWKPEYMAADGSYSKKFKYVIQCISDLLIRRQGCVYEGNPNKPDHYKTFWGYLDPEIYKEATNTYERQGPAVLRDFNMFHNPLSQVMGRLSEAPYEITVKNLTQSSEDLRINKNADILSERYIRTLIEQMQQDTGKDMSFATDPSMYIPQGNQKLVQYLSTSEQVEQSIYYLLEACMADRRTRPALIDCYQDLFIINAQAARIAVYDDIVIPERIHPHSIGVLGRMDIDDPISSANAAAVHTWRSIPEAIEKNAKFLMNHPFYKDLSKLAQSMLLEENHAYNPNIYAFGPNAINIPGAGFPADYEPTGDRLIDEIIKKNAALEDSGAGWGNMFYKNNDSTHMIMEQEGYMKVLDQKEAIVKINGKNPTDAQIEKIVRMKDYERQRNGVKFEFVEEGRKVRKDEKTILAPQSRWMSWVRLGHNILIDVGDYRYAKPKFGSQNDARLPIVLNNVRLKSIVAIGEWYAQIDNTVMLILSESINRMGADNAIRINRALIPEDMNIAEFVHWIKKEGLIFEDEPIDPVDKGRSAVTGVRVGVDSDRLTSLLALHAALRQTFDLVIGPVAAATFANTNGLGEKQIMGQQGGMALQYSMWRNTLFNNQIFQRIADVCKYEYKNADGKILYLGNAQYHVLKETADLDLQDDLKISVQIGSEAFDERRMLTGLIPQIASAQSPMEVFELALSAYYTKNPKQLLATTRSAIEMAKERQAQEAQAAQQAQQSEMELRQQQITQPVQVAQIAAQAKLDVEDKKAQREEIKIQGKGTLSDANHQDEMEIKVADAILGSNDSSPSK